MVVRLSGSAVERGGGNWVWLVKGSSRGCDNLLKLLKLGMAIDVG